jgi:hypothetical protein
VLSRRERDRSLSHRRLVRAVAGDDYTVRLFNPPVSSIVGVFRRNWMKLSNVIKDHRARLGSMREKNDHKKSSSDDEQRRDGTRSRILSFSCKKRGSGADRYRSLWQKTCRDHRQGRAHLAQPAQIPKVVRLRRPAPFGTHDKDRQRLQIRHLVSIAIRATSFRGRASPDSGLITGLLVCAHPQLPRAYALGL